MKSTQSKGQIMKADTILSYLEQRSNEQIEHVASYSEPGYSLNEFDKGILFANWNNIGKRALETLETEYKLEWNDEWSTCSDCGNAVRTSGDCYSWIQYYWLANDCEIVCGECIQVEEYEEYLLNDPGQCDTFGFDWESRGFVEYNGRYENGFHPGQTDNPADILKQAQIDFPNHDFLFGKLSSGQFDIAFNLFMRQTI